MRMLIIWLGLGLSTSALAGEDTVDTETYDLAASAKSEFEIRREIAGNDADIAALQERVQDLEDAVEELKKLPRRVIVEKQPIEQVERVIEQVLLTCPELNEKLKSEEKVSEPHDLYWCFQEIEKAEVDLTPLKDKLKEHEAQIDQNTDDIRDLDDRVTDLEEKEAKRYAFGFHLGGGWTGDFYPFDRRQERLHVVNSFTGRFGATIENDFGVILFGTHGKIAADPKGVALYGGYLWKLRETPSVALGFTLGAEQHSFAVSQGWADAGFRALRLTPSFEGRVIPEPLNGDHVSLGLRWSAGPQWGIYTVSAQRSPSNEAYGSPYSGFTANVGAVLNITL